MNEKNKPNQNKILLASAQEKENTISLLQNAFSDERLSEIDFSERLSKAMNATTIGELEAITFDLKPAEKICAPATHTHLPNRSTAIFGGVELKGDLIVPAHYHVKAVMGGIQLDLRDAHFESDHTIFEIFCAMGGVQIFVPPNVKVNVVGRPIFGGIAQKTKKKFQSQNYDKKLTIKGLVVFGGVEIICKP